MGFALVPPTHPVLAGFMGVAGGQGALVVIRLNRVNGEESPLAAVNAAFDPDAVMAVFLEVNADAGTGRAHFHGQRIFGDGMVDRAGRADDAQIMTDGLIIIGSGLDAGNLAE